MSSLVLLWAFLCIYMRREKEIAYGRTSFTDRIPDKEKSPARRQSQLEMMEPDVAGVQTLNTARRIQRNAGGHLTMTIRMAHLQPCFLPGVSHPMPGERGVLPVGPGKHHNAVSAAAGKGCPGRGEFVADPQRKIRGAGYIGYKPPCSLTPCRCTSSGKRERYIQSPFSSVRG